MGTTPEVQRRGTGGRPSLAQANAIEARLLASATALFLSQGYGATSIEAICKQAKIAKRTFYDRFVDKAALFATVIAHIIANVRPHDPAQLFEEGTLEVILHRIAQVMLHAALDADAIALQRVLLAEASRFPELARIIDNQGTRADAITRITALLERAIVAGTLTVPNPVFAAEQFLQMVISVPQRRMLGLGKPMSENEIAQWGKDAVVFFLRACR